MHDAEEAPSRPNREAGEWRLPVERQPMAVLRGRRGICRTRQAELSRTVIGITGDTARRARRIQQLEQIARIQAAAELAPAVHVEPVGHSQVDSLVLETTLV